MEKASAVKCGHPQGLLGYLLTAAEFLAAFGVNFNPMPVLDLANAPPAGALATPVERRIHKDFIERYEKYSICENAQVQFRTALLVSLPESLRKQLRRGQQVYQLTLTELWTRLNDLFNCATFLS